MYIKNQWHIIANVEDLDIVILMHNILEYSDNDSMTLGSYIIVNYYSELL